MSDDPELTAALEEFEVGCIEHLTRVCAEFRDLLERRDAYMPAQMKLLLEQFGYDRLAAGFRPVSNRMNQQLAELFNKAEREAQQRLMTNLRGIFATASTIEQHEAGRTRH